MKPLGMLTLTVAASMAVAMPVMAHDGWHHDHDEPSTSSSSGTQRTYHYRVGYRNGGSGYNFRTPGGGVSYRTGYSGPNTSISNPHRAAWNAYIRKQAHREAVREQEARPDCGLNRSPLDCRVVPYYETIVTER